MGWLETLNWYAQYKNYLSNVTRWDFVKTLLCASSSITICMLFLSFVSREIYAGIAQNSMRGTEFPIVALSAF